MAYRRRRKKPDQPRDTNAAGAGVRVPAAEATEPPLEEKETNTKVPAGQHDLPPEGADAEDLQAVHTEAIERYETAWERDRQNQTDAYDDLRFLSEDLAQWDGAALRARKDEQRPVLTVNKLPQFIRQVTGDIRQLRPSIHVVPVDERASDNLAVDVLPEMVRYIERRSDAKGAYFSAADQMVAAGIGHVRVYTEYAAGSTMNQEIAIGLIQDGLAVVWDVDAIHPTRKDANYCFVPIDMARKAAELRWPNKSFDAPLTHECWNGWYADDAVRVTEYWRKCPYEREIAVYPDGKIVDLTDDDGEGDEGYNDNDEGKETKGAADYREADDDYSRCGNCTHFRAPNGCEIVKGTIGEEMVCNHFEMNLLQDNTMNGAGSLGMLGMPARPQLGPGMGPKRADAIAGGATIEKRDSYRVERFVMSATEILDGPEMCPGMEIPIVPFLGEEIKIGRQVVRRGIVRVLKDVQRLYNYAISADAEAVALQPKAPFKGTRKNFEQFLDQWETANTRNWPFLEYDPDPLNGGRAPEREPPPVASSGIKELLQVASQDMSAVTGIYPSALGAPAQETSGRAIVARQREGDTGTYVYIEAFGRAVERIGQIIVDLIPHVYDTKRSLRVVGDDGKMSKIDINTPIIDPNGDGIDTITMNDLSIGAYQVSVEMGPSYSTKREEARDGMQTLMQTLGPQAAPLLADLFVKGQDFPLSDRIAKRLQHLLPPQIAQAEAAQSGEQPPPPPPPPPPSPEAQVQAAELKLKQQEIQGKTELEAAKLEVEKKRLQLEHYKVDAELEQARLAAEGTAIAHAAKSQQQGVDVAEGAAQRMHEARMAVTPPPTDEQQQQQIDSLIDAVTQLQQAMAQIAAMASQPPKPPGPPPGPPPGMPPLGPPPGPPGPPPGAPPPPMGPM